ncbi:MAG: hypothetical protein Barrevirus8_6 [Barrevirus sp.]|uniref:Uncharacterized protein n=1 Tax=Barrevirus sp. TaxID=2487763 RepID=A0A3G4ZQ43_9VIRU|nr:MAG: hypothetical protein Barrevirus8_6 [Barrevirus sp.]
MAWQKYTHRKSGYSLHKRPIKRSPLKNIGKIVKVIKIYKKANKRIRVENNIVPNNNKKIVVKRKNRPQRQFVKNHNESSLPPRKRIYLVQELIIELPEGLPEKIPERLQEELSEGLSERLPERLPQVAKIVQPQQYNLRNRNKKSKEQEQKEKKEKERKEKREKKKEKMIPKTPQKKKEEEMEERNELAEESEAVESEADKTPSRKRKSSEISVLSWSDFNVYTPATGFSNSDPNLFDKKEWVSATSVKNYLLRDPLLDWLDLYYLERGFNDNGIPPNQEKPNINAFVEARNSKKKTFDQEKSKLNVLFEMGHNFEDLVIADLRKRFPNDIKKVVNGLPSPDLNEITKKYILEGVPLIEQAALYNFQNKSFGVADLLIRSDWFDKIFTDEILTDEEKTFKAPLLRGNWHYRVIDIKWTTMYLCSNGKTLRNSQRFPAYKGQLAIYNAALGLLQGFTPSTAYIMAKSWNLNNNQNHGYNCYKLLGHIDYEGFDSKYIEDTRDAINWVRNVRFNGSSWSCITPSVPELFPNMCNKFDSPYHSVKSDLSKQINELTEIWNIGIKHRKIAHSKGITSWSDPKCNSLNIGMKGKKLGPVIDKIIQINRDDIGNIKPDIITNNLEDWQTPHSTDFYIDFEGVTGCLYDRTINLENCEMDSQTTFMIGLGYEEKGQWVYKTFIAESINRDEERRIFRELIQFISNKIKNARAKPRFFHWSPAEKSTMTILNKRYNNEFSKWTNGCTWIDMCKVFTSEPIVIKGATKFNLKEVAKSMNKHGFIQSSWNIAGGAPDSGLTAMFEAIEYYRYMDRPNKTKEEDEKYRRMMISITDYNEIDCKVIFEIVKYLRENHCKN